MQLHENIPTLGGLGDGPPRSRREGLRLDGERAQREIAALLRKARSRAVALAAGRGLALLAGGLSLALLAGALLASVNGTLLARGVALSLALLAAAGVVWFSLRSPLQRTAAGALRDGLHLRRGQGDGPARLARLLGGPSELLSSVELGQDCAPGVSTELLSLLHLRAAAAAKKVDVSRALPVSSLRWPMAALAGCAAVWALAAFVAPRHVSQGLARLWRGESGAPPIELSPIAGDLSITYLYPAYTGLPPRTEEGSAGDLRAPRGTEVRIAARADRDLAQAFAVVNGAAVKLDASGPGHRQLSGSFQLTQTGTWSLRFADARGRTIAQGPSRPVEIVADQPPQIAIEAPKQAVLEVDPQGQVQIAWSAADDYGLTQVSLVYQRAGGKEERVALQTPPSPARRLRGGYGWELAPLKLRAGDKVSYHLEAKDNDAVDGAQRGVSATQAIKVFSAAEHSRESLIRAQALWERLVALAADRMEEKPAPPDAAAASAWYAQTAQKDRDARALSQELYAAGSELLKDKLAPKAVGRALRYASTGLGPATQRTSLARAPLSRGASGREGAVRGLATALQNEIREEEKDILYLEDLLDRARLDAMQELGKELAASRRELARLAEKLRKAPDDQTRKELLSEVERLRERIQDLMSRMSELAKGIQDEHLNQEAAQSMERQQDLLGQLSDIQKKLQSGKIDDALKELDKLSQQLEKLEKDLQQKAGQEQGGQYAQEAKALREAAGRLKELQQKEQDLEKRTAQLRREMHKDAEKKFDQKGGKALAQQLTGEGRGGAQGHRADRPPRRRAPGARGHPRHGAGPRLRISPAPWTRATSTRRSIWPSAPSARWRPCRAGWRWRTRWRSAIRASRETLPACARGCALPPTRSSRSSRSSSNCKMPCRGKGRACRRSRCSACGSRPRSRAGSRTSSARCASSSGRWGARSPSSARSTSRCCSRRRKACRAPSSGSIETSRAERRPGKSRRWRSSRSSRTRWRRWRSRRARARGRAACPCPGASRRGRTETRRRGRSPTACATTAWRFPTPSPRARRPSSARSSSTR